MPRRASCRVFLQCAPSLFLATELFVEFLGRESYEETLRNGRKVVSRADVDGASKANDCLTFIEPPVLDTAFENMLGSAK